MATEFALTATQREAQGKQVKQVRQAGDIPGVIYGHGFENQLVQVPMQPFLKVFHKAGYSGLIELRVGERAAVHVLIAEAQMDPLGNVRHIDFHQVKMDEVVRTEVPLRLIGDAPAVYNLGGSLIQVLQEIEVEALPADLPQAVEVDISGLVEFEDRIMLSDIKLPPKVELLTEDQTVCEVEPPRSDEDMAALDAEMGDAVGEAGAEEGAEAEAGASGEASADAPAAEGDKAEAGTDDSK